MNRKLYNDNSNLVKSLEANYAETADLRDRLDEALEIKNRFIEEKLLLERNINILNDTKFSQKIEINKLIEDNQKLVRLVGENEKTIKNLEGDRIKLLSRNEEINFELKNTLGKLKTREDNLNYTQQTVDDLKLRNGKLQFNLNECEKQIEILRDDANILGSNLQNERSGRLEAEKTINQLQNFLGDRDKEINKYLSEIEALRQTNNRISDEKFILSNENERLKNHIMILTEQNQGVIFIIIY